MKYIVFVTLMLFSSLASAGKFSCVVKEASELSDAGTMASAKLPLEKVGDSFVVDETTGIVISTGAYGGTGNTLAGTPVVTKRDSFISLINHPSGDITLLQIETSTKNTNEELPFIYLKTIGTATYVTGTCKHSL